MGFESPLICWCLIGSKLSGTWERSNCYVEVSTVNGTRITHHQCTQPHTTTRSFRYGSSYPCCAAHAKLHDDAKDKFYGRVKHVTDLAIKREGQP